VRPLTLALPYSRFHRVSIYAVNNSSERVTLLHQPTSLSYLQKVRGSATDQRYRVKERPALTLELGGLVLVLVGSLSQQAPRGLFRLLSAREFLKVGTR